MPDAATDPIVRAARFIADNLEWCRHATDGTEPYAVRAYAEIDWCAGRMRGLVNGPREQKYLGPCGALVVLEYERSEVGGVLHESATTGTCDGDIYGPRGGAKGTCRTCGATVAQAEREAWLDGEVRAHAFRASEIEDAYGVKANTIRQWATPARGLIQVHGHDVEGRALYLLSHVLDIAANQAAKAAEREAGRARRAALLDGH